MFILFCNLSSSVLFNGNSSDTNLNDGFGLCVSISSLGHGPVLIAIFLLLSVNFGSGLLGLDAKRMDTLSEPRAESKSLSQALELLVAYLGTVLCFVVRCKTNSRT